MLKKGRKVNIFLILLYQKLFFNIFILLIFCSYYYYMCDKSPVNYLKFGDWYSDHWTILILTHYSDSWKRLNRIIYNYTLYLFTDVQLLIHVVICQLHGKVSYIFGYFSTTTVFSRHLRRNLCNINWLNCNTVQVIERLRLAAFFFVLFISDSSLLFLLTLCLFSCEGSVFMRPFPGSARKHS